jgi:hypothetical protein
MSVFGLWRGKASHLGVGRDVCPHRANCRDRPVQNQAGRWRGGQSDNAQMVGDHDEGKREMRFGPRFEIRDKLT